jgi:translation elongation factor EF-1alpha
MTPATGAAACATTDHRCLLRCLQLAKTLGVVKLIVVVNKLDDHSVAEDGKWSQTRCAVTQHD